MCKIAYWFSFKCVAQWRPENILRKHPCFLFTFDKIKYRSNLAARSDFTLTNRRMIIYTGKQIAIMSVFRTKLYMQHLRSLFWFLLTILSILSLTAFSVIIVGSQKSAAPRHPLLSASLLNAAFIRNLGQLKQLMQFK